MIVYAGPEDEARRVAALMLALGHEGEMIATMPYAEIQCLLDDPPGYRSYGSAEYVDAFPDEAVDLFCTRAHDMIVPSPSQHALFPQGARSDVRGPTTYPLPWRHAPWIVHPFGLWQDAADDARARRWAADMRADLKPWSSGDTFAYWIYPIRRAR